MPNPLPAANIGEHEDLGVALIASVRLEKALSFINLTKTEVLTCNVVIFMPVICSRQMCGESMAESLGWGEDGLELAALPGIDSLPLLLSPFTVVIELVDLLRMEISGAEDSYPESIALDGGEALPILPPQELRLQNKYQ